MRAMFTGPLLAAALAMTAAAQPDPFAPLAERYVRLVLAVGQHDADFVDAYNLGKDPVRAHVERLGGTADKPAERWRIFGELLSSPRLPSGL